MRRFAFLLCTLALPFAAALGACSSGRATAPPPAVAIAHAEPPAPLTLEELLPADVVGVLYLSVPEFRASALVRSAEEQLAALVPADERAQLERALEFASRVERLVAGLRVRANGGDEALLLLRGRFEPRDLTLLTRDGEASHYEGHTVVSNNDLATTLLDAQTLVIARADTLHALCDRADGRAPRTVAPPAELESALARAGTGRTLAFGLLHSEELMGPRGPEEPRIVSYDGYCQLDARVLCEGGALVPDAAERRQLYAFVQQQLAETRLAMATLPPEMSPPFDSLSVSLDDTRFVARFDADEGVAGRFVGNFLRMLFLGAQSFAMPAVTP